MAMHLTQAPPRTASLRPDLSQALCAAIDRCLEKDPRRAFRERRGARGAALDVMRSAHRASRAHAVRMFQLQATQGARALSRCPAGVPGLSCAAWPARTRACGRSTSITIAAASATEASSRSLSAARGICFHGRIHLSTRLRDGLNVILAERAEARVLKERANPKAGSRARQRLFAILAAFALSVFLFWFTLRFIRVRDAGQHYRRRTARAFRHRRGHQRCSASSTHQPAHDEPGAVGQGSTDLSRACGRARPDARCSASPAGDSIASPAPFPHRRAQ